LCPALLAKSDLNLLTELPENPPFSYHYPPSLKAGMEVEVEVGDGDGDEEVGVAT